MMRGLERRLHKLETAMPFGPPIDWEHLRLARHALLMDAPKVNFLRSADAVDDHERAKRIMTTFIAQFEANYVAG